MNHEKLINDHKKLIAYEAGKYSKMVPYDVVLAEAYKLADKAAKNFNPDKGTKFSTHLTNQLKKLSRISTLYGSSVRLPENKQFKLQHINKAEIELKDNLGREPSLQEISEYTHIPLNQVNTPRFLWIMVMMIGSILFITICLIWTKLSLSIKPVLAVKRF